MFHGGGCLGRLVCRSIICLGLGGYGGLLIWRDSATTTSASTRRYRKTAPCRTGSPARSQSVCLASWRHGPGTRGGLRARFCGAGGGFVFATRFLTRNPAGGPRHSTMRVGGVGADSWSEGGCFFGAAFRRCVRDPRLPSSGLCLWPLGQVLHEGGGAQEGLPRSRGPAHATMTLPTHCYDWCSVAERASVPTAV